jgi:hypothetical protein
MKEFFKDLNALIQKYSHRIIERLGVLVLTYLLLALSFLYLGVKFFSLRQDNKEEICITNTVLCYETNTVLLSNIVSITNNVNVTNTPVTSIPPKSKKNYEIREVLAIIFYEFFCGLWLIIIIGKAVVDREWFCVFPGIFVIFFIILPFLV